ncbi:hypothetical protein PINS_up024078 [Pythium insidiosum]|nr:hypothetical protein PINS_up024078 [Pythium insidiosum]
MGVPVFVRVAAHNTLGYGPPQRRRAAHAHHVERPAAVAGRDAQRAHGGREAAIPRRACRRSSVRFLPPQIKAPTDANGARRRGHLQVPRRVERRRLGDGATCRTCRSSRRRRPGAGALSGAFRLAFDTTGCTTCQHRRHRVRRDGRCDDHAAARTWPNVGQVTVSARRLLVAQRVTFASEIGRAPEPDGCLGEPPVVRLAASAASPCPRCPRRAAASAASRASLYCPTTPAGARWSRPDVLRGRHGVAVDRDADAASSGFVISGLTPGTTYFARVSAFHDLGFGLRRITAPASLRVPFEPPTTPTSLFNALAPPRARARGPHVARRRVRTTRVQRRLARHELRHRVGHAAVVRERHERRPARRRRSSPRAPTAPADATASTGLTPATWYYVRVYALNAEMGGGLPVATTPVREMPRGKPSAPQGVSVRNNAALAPRGFVADRALGPPPSDLATASAAPLAAVSFYRVEWFQRAPSDPFFGRSAVQVVQTRGSLSGGTFTLAFGDVQATGTSASPTAPAPSLLSWRVLPGTVDAVNGQAQYVVSASGTFSGSQLPLASSANYDATTSATLGTGATTYSGVTKSALQIRTPWKTTPLPIDCPASELQAALELLPSVGRVQVARFQVGNVGDNNFNWFITFTTQAARERPTARRHGRRSTPPSSCSRPRSRRFAYGAAFVAVNTSQPQPQLEYNVTQLPTGVAYFVRVAAINDRGLGDVAMARVVRRDGSLEPDTTLGLAATRTPLALENVRMTVRSPTAIELAFDQVATSGGLAVDGYRTLELPPSTTYHRVTTGAHTGPFLAGSTFTLATVDDRSFRGAFSQQVDALVAVSQSVTVAFGFVTRVTPDPLKGFGSADLGATFSRGEPLLLRNREASVCLDRAVAYPLPGVTTASFNGGTSVLTVTTLPSDLQALVLATSVVSVGVASMPSCVASVAAVVSATQLQLTHNCARGAAQPAWPEREPALGAGGAAAVRRGGSVEPPGRRDARDVGHDGPRAAQARRHGRRRRARPAHGRRRQRPGLGRGARRGARVRRRRAARQRDAGPALPRARQVRPHQHVQTARWRRRPARCSSARWPTRRPP